MDQPEGVTLVDVAVDFGSNPGSHFQSDYRGDLLGGVLVLRHEGVAYERAKAESMLYSRYTGQSPKSRQVPLTFIPYYAWANRQATAMQVWTPLFKA